MTSSVRLDNQETGHSYEPVDVTGVNTCSFCPEESFENASEFWAHIRGHVQQPDVVLYRISESYIQALRNREPRPPKRGSFARKRSHSYIIPKLKGGKKNCSLKLKLKLSGNSKSHFEVVPDKVLVGPGHDVCLLNGGVANSVKTEKLLYDVEWEKSDRRDDVSERPGGDGVVLDEVGEKESRLEEGSGGGDEDETGIGKGSGSGELDLVPCDEGFENEDDLISIEKTELCSLPPTPACTPAPTPVPQHLPSPPTVASPVAPGSSAASPVPGESLGAEFLPSEDPVHFAQSPAMVEINGSAVADVRSPIFPSTSPAPPSSQPTVSPSQPTSAADELESEGNCEGQEVLPDSEQVDCDSGRGSDSSFMWNDVGGNGDDMANDASGAAAALEEDPLMLPDGGDVTRDRTGEDVPGGANAAAPVEGNNQGILRDFLSEHSSERALVPVSNSNMEFSVGSEFISYDRLGENSLFCDVCGERAADQATLEEHRIRAGHFKCSQPGCGGMMFTTTEELMTHQQNVHGNQQQHSPQQQQQSPQPQYRMSPSQQQPVMEQVAAPVQQLVQQVQRLPVPQMPMQAAMGKGPVQHSPALVQQLSSAGMLMQPQPQQYPQRPPPPLHPAPAPMMQQMQQYPPPPPYPGPQPPHVMYPPQPFPPHGHYVANTRQPMPMQNRPYAVMQQMAQQQHARQAQAQPQRGQAPVMARGMAVQPGMMPQGVGGQQKRMAQTAVPPQAGAKQRRMDMLIPDRHDDADCHVIAMQKRTETGPIINSVQGAPQVSSNRSDSTINLTDSITLSLRQQQQQQQQMSPGGGKNRSDANTVASLLATRGITVTPAGATAARGGQMQVQNVQQQVPQHRQVARQGPSAVAVNVPPPQPQAPVATLNLNSAISIIPTASVRQPQKQPQQQIQQQSNFAVPQGRSAVRPQTQVERPPRPPTVDLTGDGPPPIPSLNAVMSRGRGRGRGVTIPGRHMCHICDKIFSSPETLNQHILVHRSPGKLPYRCNLCSAQYPNQAGLLQHRQTFHKESVVQPIQELVLPVVDLKQSATVARLNSLGVRHYVPLSQLASQVGGTFGLPIISIEGGRVPTTNLTALGAANVLSLGPLRQLPR